MKTIKWLLVVVATAVVGGTVMAAEDGVPDMAALVRLIEQQGKQLEAQQAQLKVLNDKLTQLEAASTETKQLKKDVQELAVWAGTSAAAAEKGGGGLVQLGPGIDGLKITGDMRVRAETRDLSQKTGTAKNLSRFRERLRVGGIWTNKAEDWEIGAGLVTGNDASGVTGNSDWGQDTKGAYDHLGLWLDYAYAKHKWSVDGTPASLTLGKQKNPFVTSKLNWGDDLRPEGVTLQYGDAQAKGYDGAFVTGGIYTLNALSSSGTYTVNGKTQDSFADNAYHAQLQVGYKYRGEKSEWLGAVGYQKITDAYRNSAASTLFQKSNIPNSATSDTGYGYDILDAYTEYKTTIGDIEFKPYGHIAYNSSAGGTKSQQTGAQANGDGKLGWLLGVDAKKGAWTVGYGYLYAGSDSVFGPFRDPSFGSTSGLPDTDIQGHLLRGGYDVTKNFNLGITWYILDRISPVTATTPTKSQLLQLDAVYKF